MRWRRFDSETAARSTAARLAAALLLAAAGQTAWTQDAAAAAETPGEAAKPAETDASASAPADDAQEASAQASEGADASALDVETILNNPLDDDAYSQRRTCLLSRAIDRVEVLDETMVLFHVRRNKAWLNQLSSRCLGLERDMIINLRIFGGSLCRLDTFRGMTRMGGGHMPTAHCRLGDFEAIEGPQIDALRTALEERRKAAKLERKTRRAERRAERRERRKAKRE